MTNKQRTNKQKKSKKVVICYQIYNFFKQVHLISMEHKNQLGSHKICELDIFMIIIKTV